MDNENRSIVLGDWDSTTVAMMKRLRRYVTQIQGTLPQDPQNRPLMLVNANEVQKTGLLKSLEEIIEEPPNDMLFPVSYMEGIPTIFGTPIWEKLEGENLTYFELFKRYRSLPKTHQTRSIYKLSQECGTPITHLELLRQCYHWGDRVVAYDLYLHEQQEIILEQRRKEIQGKHSKAASELFNKCTEYMIANIDKLTPKTALEWAEMAVKLERMSVGLQPDKPGMTDGNHSSGTTVNINNSQLTKNGDGSPDTTKQHGTGVTGNKEEDKDRLAQMVNVMQKIGLFETKTEVKDMEEVSDDDDN